MLFRYFSTQYNTCKCVGATPLRLFFLFFFTFSCSFGYHKDQPLCPGDGTGHTNVPAVGGRLGGRITEVTKYVYTRYVQSTILFLWCLICMSRGARMRER